MKTFPVLCLGIVLAAASTLFWGGHGATKVISPKSHRVTTFDASARLLQKGDYAGAIVLLRKIQAGRDLTEVSEATQLIARALVREGRPREAVAEYVKLLSLDRPGSGYFNSELTDGSIHSRIACLALDLGDEALLERTCDDLAGRMERQSARIRQSFDEAARVGPKGRASPKTIQRLTKQARELDDQTRVPPLLIMARNLEGHYDVRHVDPLYERALRGSRDPRLLYEYARTLEEGGGRRAALRVFRRIPTPYPKDLDLSIRDDLYRLSEYVKATPNKTEAEEHAAAIRWSAKFQHDL